MQREQIATRASAHMCPVCAAAADRSRVFGPAADPGPPPGAAARGQRGGSYIPEFRFRMLPSLSRNHAAVLPSGRVAMPSSVFRPGKS